MSDILTIVASANHEHSIVKVDDERRCRPCSWASPGTPREHSLTSSQLGRWNGRFLRHMARQWNGACWVATWWRNLGCSCYEQRTTSLLYLIIWFVSPYSSFVSLRLEIISAKKERHARFKNQCSKSVALQIFLNTTTGLQITVEYLK